MDGIVNLYKNVDMTSQQAVSRIKRILNIKKAGHTGTLDPLVLPKPFIVESFHSRIH